MLFDLFPVDLNLLLLSTIDITYTVITYRRWPKSKAFNWSLLEPYFS